jgi:putative oxidoreductase
MLNNINDGLVPAARLLLATLFLIFGWRKLPLSSEDIEGVIG